MVGQQDQGREWRGIDFYYLFGPKSAAHIQFYNAWVEAARGHGVPIVLLGVLPGKFRSTGRERILGYAAKPHVKVLKSGRLVGGRLRVFLFFLRHLVRGRRLIVQVHKMPTEPLDWLKRFAGDRLQYAITLEGDPVSEADYLREHPFRPGFYDADMASAPARAEELHNRLKRADHVLPVSKELRFLLDQRYPELQLLPKSTVIPTGFDQGQRFFSPRLREETRTILGIEDRFVVTYIGNIYYTWQNFARTVAIYDLLRRETAVSLFFLLLIRREDHGLAQEFLDRGRIGAREYLLEHVSSSELTRYLNAADLGVVLRHNHAVSRVAGLPGKLGDYAGCGLPVLTNIGVVGSSSLAEIGAGAVLEDMDDDEEVLTKVPPLFEHDPKRRRRIEAWAHTEHSAAAHADRYADLLRRLAAGT